MNRKQREDFYIEAALGLNLDSDEVDDALATRGLNAQFNTLEKCRAALKAAYPERYRLGRTAYLEGDTDA
jgi:hypothetical protein